MCRSIKGIAGACGHPGPHALPAPRLDQTRRDGSDKSAPYNGPAPVVARFIAPWGGTSVPACLPFLIGLMNQATTERKGFPLSSDPLSPGERRKTAQAEACDYKGGERLHKSLSHIGLLHACRRSARGGGARLLTEVVFCGKREDTKGGFV